jgi:hypothetical protein
MGNSGDEADMGSGSGQDAFDTLVDRDFVKIAGFDEIGLTWHGVIVDAKWVQERVYDMKNPGKGKLLWWENKATVPYPPNPENPDQDRVMALHIVFQTDVRTGDDDDGRREIWLNKYQLKEAFKAAWKGAGTDRPRLGDWWRVTRVKDVKPRGGSNNARGWEVLYKTAAQYDESGPSDSAFVGAATVKDDDNPFA